VEPLDDPPDGEDDDESELELLLVASVDSFFELESFPSLELVSPEPSLVDLRAPLP
jgi:hypothetical protein